MSLLTCTWCIQKKKSFYWFETHFLLDGSYTRLLSSWRLEAGISESYRSQTAKDMTTKSSSSSSPVPPPRPPLPPRLGAAANIRYSSAHTRPHTSCQVKNGVTESSRIGRRESKAMGPWPFHTDDALFRNLPDVCRLVSASLVLQKVRDREKTARWNGRKLQFLFFFFWFAAFKCDGIKWPENIYFYIYWSPTSSV